MQKVVNITVPENNTFHQFYCITYFGVVFYHPYGLTETIYNKKMFLLQSILPLFLLVLSAIDGHTCGEHSWCIRHFELSNLFASVFSACAPCPYKSTAPAYQPAACGAYFILLPFLGLLSRSGHYHCTDTSLCKHSPSDSLRLGRSQARTNDPGQVDLSPMPSSNVRWQFTSALAYLVIYRCEQPLVFPYNNILVLPSGKGLQSVDYSYCDLDQRICSSPLPGHLMCSDTVDIVQDRKSVV